MVISDMLSRLAQPDDPSLDNENRVMLPEGLFKETINLIRVDFTDRIRKAKMQDAMVTDAVEALKKDGFSAIQRPLIDWNIDNDSGLVTDHNKVYVPDDLELRRDICKAYHDTPATGHPGIQATLELIRRDFWWPGMYTFVRKFVEGCTLCQQMKVNTHPTMVPLQPIPATTNALPFTGLSVDFITDLPRSDGADSIMVVVDHDLTKGVILIPCNKTIDALETARLFHKHVFTLYGLPT